MKTKNAVIGGAVALAILLVITGVLAAREYNRKPTYSALIVNGRQYLKSGNYDDAILEYKAAIELDETQEDAYVGLSIVYRTQNLMNLALETLQEGLERCNSVTEIQSQIKQYFPDALDGSDARITQDAKGGALNERSQRSNSTWNAELLQFISTATFGDYQDNYPDLTSRIENGLCIVEIQSLNVRIVFSDRKTQRVINTTLQEPFREFLPDEVVFDDFSVLFGDVTSMTYESLQVAEDISGLTQDSDQIEFEVYGCWVVVPCNQDGTLNTASPVTLYPTGVSNSEGTYTLHGNVTDAASGSLIQNADMQFYVGAGVNGACYTTATDSNGNYSVVVDESGIFTVVISKEGYQTKTLETYVTGLSDQTYRDFTISQERNQEIFIEFMDGARSHVDSRTDTTNIMYCLGTSGSNVSNDVVTSRSVYLLLAQWQLKDTDGNILGTSEDLEWVWNLNITGSVARPHSDGVMYQITGSFSRDNCAVRNFAEGSVYVYNNELIAAGLASEYQGNSTALTVNKAELQFWYKDQLWTIDLTGEDVLFHKDICSAFGIATAKQSEQIEIDAVPQAG